ncbi:hypothetical protein Goklo_015652, partial [Gossypium klotzschianum]|nr:hypothetical protein [Gossypium klotzschianum]
MRLGLSCTNLRNKVLSGSIQRFNELMLQISELSGKKIFYWLKYRLKPWAKQKLHRLSITELTVAVAEAESFIELGLKKDKFEFSKPKETGNGRGDHEEDGNKNNRNGKNDGNERLHNGKVKPNNRSNGPIKCFLCDGPYMVRDYPKKSMFSAIGGDDELDKAFMRLGSIVCFIEAKRVKENEKKPM